MRPLKQCFGGTMSKGLCRHERLRVVLGGCMNGAAVLRLIVVHMVYTVIGGWLYIGA